MAKAKDAGEMLTAKQLVRWLKKQNPKTKYNWHSTQNCLVAEYLRARGIADPSGETIFRLDVGNTDQYHEIAGTEPFTYGAALKRAKAAIAAAS